MISAELIQCLFRLREIFPKEYQRRESTNEPEHAFFCIEWWLDVFDEETQELSEEPVFGGRCYGRREAATTPVSVENLHESYCYDS